MNPIGFTIKAGGVFFYISRKEEEMRNIEILRDYFLGKDPQLKETMADNSLRLIGIPGREFVLKVDFFKALKDLRDALEEEKRARQQKDTELERTLDALNATVESLADWANNSDFVYQDDLDEALGGYYTKAQVDALVSTIPTFNIEIVQTLPTEDISDSTIYLLAKQDGSGNDYYDEYLHVDGNWELIGSTSVDIDGYVKKTGDTMTGSLAIGGSSTASGSLSFAQGLSVTASGEATHAEGLETTASGARAHAEGWQTQAIGIESHAEGAQAIARRCTFTC